MKRVLAVVGVMLFSSQSFALTRFDCKARGGASFVSLKQIAGDAPTWDVSYEFEDPIDGIERIFKGTRDGLNCKFDLNDNIAPSFYCASDDGWKVSLSVNIDSAFNTDLDLDASEAERTARHFTLRISERNASRIFHGKSPWNSSSECKWQ